EVTGKFLKGGERIFEVPITYRARSREEGKKLHWTDGVEALWILLRIRLLGR
ncbi:glycosyl transferase, partial [cyanobacterium TDX16]